MKCKNCKTDSVAKLGPLALFCGTCGVLETNVSSSAPLLLLTSTCCPIGQPYQAHRIKIANAKLVDPEDYMRGRSAKIDDRTGDVELKGMFTIADLLRIMQIADEAKWGTP